VAVELVRSVWCDIDLKKNKTKVPATEAVTTILQHGKLIKIDACAEHTESLTVRQILDYGYQDEQPHPDRSRMGEKIRDTAPRRGGTRALVQCSLCDKQVTMGSGWGLHNNAHIRRSETTAEPIPVAV
jgi:hypothetical protein